MKKTITRNQTSRNHRDQSDRVPERVLLARERYAARLSAQWRTVHGERSAQDCIAKLDVMKISCVSDPLAALRAIPNLRCVASTYVRPRNKDFRGYFRVSRFQWDHSTSKIVVESEPWEGWLPRFRVTFIADDSEGLTPRELFSVLEVLPRFRLSYLEIAFDFCMESGVSREFVEQHGKFGKTRRNTRRRESAGDAWGARGARVRAISYTKVEVGGHRVELKLYSTFLRQHRVIDCFDFHKLATILPQRYLYFARIEFRQVNRSLRKTKLDIRARRKALRQARNLKGNLGALLSFLRRDVRIQNAHRFLVAMPENQIATIALRDWCALWPPKPKARLENL